jgi:hypothetical protein
MGVIFNLVDLSWVEVHMKVRSKVITVNREGSSATCKKMKLCYITERSGSRKEKERKKTVS